MIECLIFSISMLLVCGAVLFGLGYYTEHKNDNCRLNKRQLKEKYKK